MITRELISKCGLAEANRDYHYLLFFMASPSAIPIAAKKRSTRHFGEYPMFKTNTT